MFDRRRLLIALAALPIGLARAQPAERPGKTMGVGVINYGTRASYEATPKLFADAMRDLGWVEGRNITYDNVFADSDVQRLPTVAAELVARTPDLIFTFPTAATVAAHASTRTIPIVFGGSNGVVELGLAKTLAHPGGNVTGVQNFSWELGGKRLQLLKQALPKIKRVGVLVQPDNPLIEREFNTIGKAAATLGLTVIRANAKAPGDIDGAIASPFKNGSKPCSLPRRRSFRVSARGLLNLPPAGGCRWSARAANLPRTARSYPTAFLSAINTVSPRA